MDLAESLPRRPILRPGLRVVRRDDRHLQIGVEVEERLVLPDQDGVRRLLDDLLAGRRPDLADPLSRRWCHDLVARGYVVDADQVDRALRGPAPRAAVIAAFAVSGPSAAGRLDARSAARVVLDAEPPWREAAQRLLAAAGLTTASRREPPTVRLVVNGDARLTDALMRSSEPHLLVSDLGGQITVGPLVAPGLTACQRCVTAHRCDRDPGHAVIMEQHRSGDRGPAVPDPVRMQLALALAVHDLVSFVEGDPPSTWSATITIDPALALARESWLRHPGCGCCWGDGLAATG